MSRPATRNPGPSWGYSFLRALARWVPDPVFVRLLHLGATLAIPLLPNRARASRRYLRTVLDRPASWGEVRRHFIAFADFLVLRFRVAEGLANPCRIDPDHAGDFEARASGPDPVIFGTFHLGHSDLLGFWLTRFERSVRMIRHRVGNSNDLDWLHRRFKGRVEFIWVNDPAQIPFAIRDAIQEGHSIAMKCDRPDFSSKTACFSFLGHERDFPMTLYHLAIIFDLPALLAFGMPNPSGGTRVFSLPAFVPLPGQRQASLQRAEAHFREALELVEGLLRKDPYQWFNFQEDTRLRT